MKSKQFGLSSFWLKIIASVLMTLDHFALLFIDRGYGDIPTAYYILRAIGKISFPIFVFLAVQSVYHTHSIRKYLLRLGCFAIGIDLFGFLISAICQISIATNPLIGNVFTDIFMGVLAVHLLKRKDRYSLFALLPIAYEVLSDITVDANWGTLFKSDWGTFSVILFIAFFLAKEISEYLVRRKAEELSMDPDIYCENNSLTPMKIGCAIALVSVEMVFYLIYRINYTCPIIPNEFVPIGTYSCIAILFILLYNGERGFTSRKLQYAFYAYYPFHLIILSVISLFAGVLASYL